MQKTSRLSIIQEIIKEIKAKFRTLAYYEKMQLYAKENYYESCNFGVMPLFNFEQFL